jgi:hypothetical protein
MTVTDTANNDLAGAGDDIAANDTAICEVVSAMLVADGIGDGDWLNVSVGPHLSSGVWTTMRALLADDADGQPGAGLGVLATAIAATRDGLPGKLAWASMHSAAIWPVADVATQVLRRSGRLLRLRASTLRFGLRLDDDEPGIRRLHITVPELVVQPSDELAGTPGIEVRSFDEMLHLLVSDLVELAAPVVDVVRRRSSIGRRGLWGGILDLLVSAFADRDADDAGPDDQHRRVDHVLRATRGTPLDQRVSWVDFTHGDGQKHTMLLTTSCCLAYKWPDAPDHEPRRDGCDRAWDRYCFSCPLIPAEESIHRARYWLDHPDE